MRKVELKELNRNERFSKGFEEVLTLKVRKIYIPPMTYSWKVESFKKQMHKSHYKHQFA